jgi:hypothetical protein
LTPRKVAGLTVITQEVAVGQTSDAALANDLAAISLASDIFAFDPNSPTASARCTSFASTGATLSAIDADLARAIRLLAGSNQDESLLNASWIMSTAYATFLSTLRGTAGAPSYPGVTALGGELLGIPILTTAGIASNTSPALGTVLLVDGSQIAQNNNDSVGLDASSEASLVMDDASPAGAQSEVSMFETNSVCLRAQRWLSVARQKAGSCVAITSVAGMVTKQFSTFAWALEVRSGSRGVRLRAGIARGRRERAGRSRPAAPLARCRCTNSANWRMAGRIRSGLRRGSGANGRKIFGGRADSRGQTERRHNDHQQHTDRRRPGGLLVPLHIAADEVFTVPEILKFRS